MENLDVLGLLRKRPALALADFGVCGKRELGHDDSPSSTVELFDGLALNALP
jgi:hypothetical protein